MSSRLLFIAQFLLNSSHTFALQVLRLNRIHGDGQRNKAWTTEMQY